MNLNRRSFLLKGAVAATGIAAATAGVDRFTPVTKPTNAGATPGGVGPVPTAGSYLGPDGKLVQLGADGRRRLPLPVLDPKVRKGIPGKRFVMVIDLARCDGCGQCQ